MTSIEMMYPKLGDVFIDAARGNGVGFNACSIRNLKVHGHDISFMIDAVPSLHTIHVRFAGLDKNAQYRITWNGNQSSPIDGATLLRNGFTIRR